MRGAAREHRQIILIKVDQFERLRTCRGFLAARNSYSPIRNVQLDMFLTIALPAPRPEKELRHGTRTVRCADEDPRRADESQRKKTNSFKFKYIKKAVRINPLPSVQSGPGLIERAKPGWVEANMLLIVAETIFWYSPLPHSMSRDIGFTRLLYGFNLALPFRFPDDERR